MSTYTFFVLMLFGLIIAAGVTWVVENFARCRDLRLAANAEHDVQREELAAKRWYPNPAENLRRLAAGEKPPTSLPTTVLHPAMTAQQIAEWCARYDAYVEIRHAYLTDGSVKLLMVPRHNERAPA